MIDMANQTGKRYVCGTCGSEMLVTRAGDGQLECCGQPMALKVTSPSSKPAQASAQRPPEVPRA
jgi:desulfoferrodoxin-like iron-binding protein